MIEECFLKVKHLKELSAIFLIHIHAVLKILLNRIDVIYVLAFQKMKQ